MHNKFIKKINSLLLKVLLPAISLCSCESFYDSYKDCHIFLRFNFDYDMTMSRQNNFAEQAEKIEVFLFDRNSGILVQTVTDTLAAEQSDYQLEIPIYSGDYTVMAWAGRKDSYDLTDMEVGTSTKDDLILKLKSINATHSSELEPLWHGEPLDFTYSGNSHQVETINLKKNTNLINVAIVQTESIKKFNLSDIDVKLTAANGAYNYKNEFADEQIITYTPFSASTSANEQLDYKLNTLRLVKGENVRFSIIDRPTGKTLLEADDVDFINLLLKIGHTGMTDQEFLDRQSVWNIKVYASLTTTGYLSIILEINDWVVWKQDVEL